MKENLGRILVRKYRLHPRDIKRAIREGKVKVDLRAIPKYINKLEYDTRVPHTVSISDKAYRIEARTRWDKT